MIYTIAGSTTRRTLSQDAAASDDPGLLLDLYFDEAKVELAAPAK